MKKLFLLLLVFAFISCSDNDPKPEDETNPNTEVPDDDEKPGDDETPFEIDLTIGDKHNETPVRILKSDDAIYIVGDVELDYRDNSGSGYDDWNGGARDLIITKFSLEGVKEWQKCVGGASSEVLVDAAIKDNTLILVGWVADMSIATSGWAANIAKIMVWKINDEGELIQEKQIETSSTYGSACRTVTVTDDNILFFYYKQHSNYLSVATLDFDLNVVNDKRLIDDPAKQARWYAVKNVSDGFIICGSGSKGTPIMKLNSDLSIAWYHTYSNSGLTHLYDIEETSDGYLAVGSTKAGRTYVNNKYYDVVHSPTANKSIEMAMLKIDKEGNFDFTKQWQIGVGYLQSGWRNEFENRDEQVDVAYTLIELEKDKFAIFGQGACHEGHGVEGAGNVAKINYKGMCLYIDASYNAVNNESGAQTFFSWERQFYNNVLLKKKLFDDFTYIKDVIEINGRYLVLGTKQVFRFNNKERLGDLIIKTYDKNDFTE